MARGTQHRKSRTQANARVGRAAAKSTPSKPKKSQHASWEDQLFFSRLRTHTKWVFGFLAVVFGLSFVLLGVGSGSSGIGDILSNAFSFGSTSSTPSVSEAQKETRERPKDPQAWRALATALVQNDRTEEAIVALARYTALKPKDADALQQLAGLHLVQADGFAQEYVDAQTKSQLLTPNSTFVVASTSPFSKAFEDPLSSAVQTSSTKITTDAYTNYIAAESRAVDVYKKLVAINPKDATNQYGLAQVAQAAGDTKTAIAGYKKFLVLAPNDSLAPAAKQALKQLTSTATPTATAG